MRAFTIIFALAFTYLLAFTPPAAAKLDRRLATTPTRSVSPAPQPIELRQHRERRALLAVCAYIDTGKLLDVILLGLPLSELADLKICLCLSALPLVIDMNVQLKALADRHGHDLIDAVLSLLVSSQSVFYERLTQ